MKVKNLLKSDFSEYLNFHLKDHHKLYGQGCKYFFVFLQKKNATEALILSFYAKYQICHIFKYFLLFWKLPILNLQYFDEMSTSQAQKSVFVRTCNFLKIKILGKLKLCIICIKNEAVRKLIERNERNVMYSFFSG